MSIPLYQSGGSGGSSLATPVSLANGGTHADLSATGGANQIVKQSTVGGDLSVGALVAADVPNLDASKITTGILAPANGGYLNETTGSIGQCMWIPDGAPLGATGTGGFDGAAHRCRFVMFKVTERITVTRATVNVTTTANGSHLYFGIYDALNTTLLAQFTYTMGVGTGVLTTTKVGGGSVTLTPGWYILAWASDVTTATVIGLTWSTTLTGIYNSQFTRIGQGAAGSPEAGGVLPANIGTTVAATINVPLLLLEVS